MNTIKKLTVIGAFMLATVAGMAKEPKLNLLVNKGTKSLVFELDTQSEKTRIRFSDELSNIIYSESVSGAVYSKRFNLESLADGTYFLTSENSLKLLIYTISIEDEIVKILESKEVLKPIFKKADAMVYLNLLNLEQEKVKIKVYDSADRLLYSQVIVGEAIIERAFNFKTAEADEYSIVVKKGAGTYYEHIIIN